MPSMIPCMRRRIRSVVRRTATGISTNGRAPASRACWAKRWMLRQAIDEWLLAADEARRKWKAQSVLMEANVPAFETLNKLYDDRAESRTASPESQAPSPRAQSPEPRVNRPGSVALVGAGPGDPGLWTVRAVRVLQEADLVLYDALVDVNALRRATKAQCFSVGKRARRDSVPQDTINRLLIRAAKQGKRVVRLKGGDPFVFGRGGEEALALAMAGIA
jgi:uroporphyrin-III C-methyltransferase/precorrin-2 dehydrogenase/sirohydrochlorin ferrochelatase